jgi:addiction module HigA family antidote
MWPVHPGEILFEEFMKPAEPPINANRLAKALDVPANRITAIINGQRGITGDTAVRLATLFDTTAEFWMNLQKTYELRLAERALSGEVRSTLNKAGYYSGQPNCHAMRSWDNGRHAIMCAVS